MVESVYPDSEFLALLRRGRTMMNMRRREKTTRSTSIMSSPWRAYRLSGEKRSSSCSPGGRVSGGMAGEVPGTPWEERKEVAMSVSRALASQFLFFPFQCMLTLTHTTKLRESCFHISPEPHGTERGDLKSCQVKRGPVGRDGHWHKALSLLSPVSFVP